MATSRKFREALMQSGRFLFTDVGDHGLGPDWDALVGFVNSIRETPMLPKDDLFIMRRF